MTLTDLAQKHNLEPESAKAFLREIGTRRPNPSTDPDLAFEVNELRKEISMLRAELKPVKGLIVTGQHVLDEFKRITGKGNQ